MKLARFWSKETGEATRPDGSAIRTVARGWSNESLAEAAQRARQTAAKLAAALASGNIERRHYLYGERPLPEPVLREFRGGARAVVTRNSYGVHVLNTESLMFIDIDREDPTKVGDRLTSGLKSLFGKAAPPPDRILEDLRRIAERNGLSLRLYKTAAGFRGIVTNVVEQAVSHSTQSLLQQFGADPLYIRLCRAQESFRARLTPKPWRCWAGLPPVSFPFRDSREESLFRDWEARYASATARFATCRYLATLGLHRIEPSFEALIRFHDEETKSSASLPLA